MRALALLNEAKLHELLPEASEDRRLEASGVFIHDDHVFIIFDNESQIARIEASLAPSAHNRWLGERDGTTGHEDITYNRQQERFYVLIEAIPVTATTYQAEVVEYDRSFSLLERHLLPVDFSSGNKGFEGLTYVQREGADHVLALCEGNRCQGGRDGRQKGNGWIHIFRRDAHGWLPVGRLTLPATAQFTDHSSLDIQDGRVAVLSQEGAMVWIGVLDDADWRFVDAGTVYHLPTRRRSKPDYCYAEGVAWLAPDQIVVVSDRRKQGDPQRCDPKDESVHVFRIP